MNRRQLDQFVSRLLDRAVVYAPTVRNGELIVHPVSRSGDIRLSNDVPMTTFKPVLLPQRETLFQYAKSNLRSAKPAGRCVGFGLTIPDLKAASMFEQVFKRDPAYQARRKRSLIIGYAEAKNRTTLIGPLQRTYPVKLLSHLSFDVCVVRTKPGHFRLYTGSQRGRTAVRGFASMPVQFAGFESEAGSPWLTKYRDALLASHGKPIWEYWGNRCLACGKCAIDCPMCFCFNLDDEPDAAKPGTGERVRHWTTCFFNDFSAIGGSQQFLKTNSQRIENWYVHKFVRTPREYALTGCVDCGRCDRVCPAGITRRDVLKSLEQPGQVPPKDLKSPRPVVQPA